MSRLSYVPGNSPLHRLNPVSNFVILICIMILLLFFSKPIFSLIILVVILCMYLLAGLKAGLVIKKARFIIYFGIFIFLIQALFNNNGEVLFTLIPQSSPVLAGWLPITSNGLEMGLSMMLRFLGIVLASLLFVSVTDPNHFAFSLMQLGLPYRYGFMLVTALRFLPTFEIEANTVKKAQLTRGIRLQKKGFSGLYSHVKYTMRPLIVSALQKAETVSRSMEGRGFGVYKHRTFIDKNQVTITDKIITGSIIVITAMLLLSFTLFYNQNELADLIFTFLL